ncbi:MAG TPA: hypothetical protein VM534_00520, partial [Thermoanaerobaculia bacterium]|nr:hypothetical protein [Thermoanaerobaculia bacterium]
MTSTLLLLAALAFYAAGSAAALVSLLRRSERGPRLALWIMSAGFVVHTAYIGTICSRTGHPPLTNLHETVIFLAWLLFGVELILNLRFRVRAAGFFVYPMVLMLLTIGVAVGEHALPLESEFVSALFIAHLLLSTVGI